MGSMGPPRLPPRRGGRWTAARVVLCGVAAAGCLGLGAPALAAQVKTSISASGTPLLQVATATPGLPPSGATNTASTYAVGIARNSTPQRITVELSSAMPPGVTLELTMAAPPNAISNGSVTLGTTAVEAVYNILELTDASGLQLTYRLEATSAAGVVPLAGRTVTFTLLN